MAAALLWGVTDCATGTKESRAISEENFLPFALPDIGEEEISAAVEALRSGWLTTGPRSVAFELEFADAIGGDVHAVAVNSATAGLHLALEAVGVGLDDEVIVPTWTFTSTAEVVRYLGAHPIFVDVDVETLNMDFDAASQAITHRTKAIIPVHFAGLAVDRAKLESFAAQYGISVVEDAAHAFPATSGGTMVGNGSSAAVVFSFYATKTITTGEGGMVVTQDAEIARRARTMRLHGISRDVFDRYRSKTPAWRYDVLAPGYKYNLTDPAAAIGRVQLRRASAMRNKRAAIAERYKAAFSELPLILPAGAVHEDMHAWHLYVIRLNSEARVTRDDFIDQMMKLGVGCSVHFIPLHMQPYWRDAYSLSDSQFPVASKEFGRAVSIPIFSSMSDDQIEKVIRSVCSVAI